MASYVEVNPDLLRWAIDRSGLPKQDFREPVEAWLKKEKRPTFNQLEAFARRAMVPFGYLFLTRPPKEELPVPDYRTRKDQNVRKPSPNLIETIFEMQRRQEWMREYLDEEGHQALPFVASTKVGQSPTRVAQDIRQVLGLSKEWAAKQQSWETALRNLRLSIENAGILIFVNGIVGNSTRRKLDPKEFQGFVLVDPVAPLIFVNGADYKVAQMFTIAHELVHVWVGQSALFDLEATRPSDVGVEEYCNAVAAEFLVPAATLETAWPQIASGDAGFIALARMFKVSPIVAARRAKDCDLISEKQFYDFYHRYMNRERQKNEGKASGGDFWKTQNLRLGQRFGRAVISAAMEGRLSYSSAYDLTRLSGETYDKYVRHLEEKSPE
jgi:Zn-dependent peptidase ImmA (M78 family)